MTLNNVIRSAALVIPVYNESEGLTHLFTALKGFHSTLTDIELKVVFVDDHSDDNTQTILRSACLETDWFSFIRLSRRAGSHMAIIAGLKECLEDCAVFLAADLQDPLELVPHMIDLCRNGNDVVWGVRDGRDGQSWFEHYSSHLFYQAMKKLSNVGDLPFQASFALLSRRAYMNLVKNAGPRTSLIVEIPYLGYSIAQIPFKKPARKFGQSKWSLGRKLLALTDAVVSSSYMPLRFMIYSGTAISIIGFLYAIALIFLWSTSSVQVRGWTSTMIVLLILGGLQMLMIGIMGEYLWRSTENTRKRALFLIEDSANVEKEALHG
jgi:dolichol-phosphate mannosyltransferase